MAVAAGQSRRFYTGVGIFNWHYLSSPPQVLLLPVVRLETGGLIFVPTNPHGPFSGFKNIDLERSYGHFGPINKCLCLEALILDTGFRCPLALNGRSFRINAHLAVNPTPHHRLKEPKPEGSML